MLDDVYVDLDGKEIRLRELDSAERGLISRLKAHARTDRVDVRPEDWNDFDNFSTREINKLYDARGVSRKAATQTAAWKIARDLSARLGIAAGTIRPPDYRDELEDLVLTRFRSRRAFCKKTGLSEDMLSHVLAGRKDLSMQTLTKALDRIGYRLTIAPAVAVKKKRTG